ncbi:MAG TPA: DNA polymerase domain-containing protein, partial [Candidatus Lokiarchaeia archaeon]
SITWTAFFRSLCGAGSSNKHLPTFIFNVEKKYKELLYKYYLIGDGCVEQGKNTFTTKSVHLVSGLCYLLKSWKIDTSIYYYEKRDVYRVREREKSIDSMHPIKTKLITLPYKERYVYDLSVENTEMFVDACGMILLHNTDSIFLLNPPNAQLKILSEWCKKDLDLDLEQDKVYQFLALSQRKKNYIGIFKDTKYIDIKGLVAKKKNTPNFIKKVFAQLTNILKEITTEEEFNAAKNKIIEIIRDNQKKIGKLDAFSLEDYAINIVLKKGLNGYDKVVPQHVRAAKELKEVTKREVQKGEVMTLIKTKGNVGAKAIQLAKLQDVDTKKYQELLRSALEQLLDALGISYDEIKGIKKMDAFF